MKIFMYIFCLFFSISLFAKDFEYKLQYKSDKVNCCVANYELCLMHENEGVVESALVNVIRFKYRCPDADYESIIKQLKQLFTFCLFLFFILSDPIFN